MVIGARSVCEGVVLNTTHTIIQFLQQSGKLGIFTVHLEREAAKAPGDSGG